MYPLRQFGPSYLGQFQAVNSYPTPGMIYRKTLGFYIKDRMSYDFLCHLDPHKAFQYLSEQLLGVHMVMEYIFFSKTFVRGKQMPYRGPS